MQKKILLVGLIMLIILSFSGCEKNESPSGKKWDVVYKTLLDNLYSGKEDPKNLYEKEEFKDFDDEDFEDMEFEFLLKYIDENNIPELVIKDSNVNVAVYTFNEKLEKVGNYCFESGTTRLFYSDDPSYPGILTFDVGGGYDHYGYLTIKDGKLSFDELWDYDFSGTTEELVGNQKKTIEYSDDKQLIKESQNAYKKKKDLQFQSLHSDNFNLELPAISSD